MNSSPSAISEGGVVTLGGSELSLNNTFVLKQTPATITDKIAHANENIVIPDYKYGDNELNSYQDLPITASLNQSDNILITEIQEPNAPFSAAPEISKKSDNFLRSNKLIVINTGTQTRPETVPTKVVSKAKSTSDVVDAEAKISSTSTFKPVTVTFPDPKSFDYFKSMFKFWLQFFPGAPGTNDATLVYNDDADKSYTYDYGYAYDTSQYGSDTSAYNTDPYYDYNVGEYYDDYDSQYAYDDSYNYSYGGDDYNSDAYSYGTDAYYDYNYNDYYGGDYSDYYAGDSSAYNADYGSSYGGEYSAYDSSAYDSSATGAASSAYYDGSSAYGSGAADASSGAYYDGSSAYGTGATDASAGAYYDGSSAYSAGTTDANASTYGTDASSAYYDPAASTATGEYSTEYGTDGTGASSAYGTTKDEYSTSQYGTEGSTTADPKTAGT